MNWKLFLTRAGVVLAALLLLTGSCTGIVFAQEAPGEEEEEDDDDGDTIINIDLEPVVDALKELLNEISNWEDKLTDILTDVIFGPFEALAKALIDLLTYVITSYPTVHPNPEVEEIHRLTFTVAVAFSGLIFAATGILYIVGPVLGVSYARVRMVLPRVIIALIFGAVAPQLLQYAVDLSHATTVAFKPSEGYILGTVRLIAELALVAVINASLLLAVTTLFLIRDVYILFAASIAPLIALGWALPYAKGYADSLIGTFWAALLIGPLDMLVFRLAFSFLQHRGGKIPNWLWSIATLTLLLIVPYLVFNASQSMIGTGRRMIPSRSKAKSSQDRRNQDGSSSDLQNQRSRTGPSGRRSRGGGQNLGYSGRQR